MKKIDQKLDEATEEYRDDVENRHDSLLNLLWRRDQLPKNPNVKGGDKYLKKDLNLDVKAFTDRYSTFYSVTIKGLEQHEDILLLARYADLKMQVYNEIDEKFESMMRSIQQIYKLSKDVLECPFWIEDDNKTLEFTTG